MADKNREIRPEFRQVHNDIERAIALQCEGQKLIDWSVEWKAAPVTTIAGKDEVGKVATTKVERENVTK